jgi:hypothetical protein
MTGGVIPAKSVLGRVMEHICRGVLNFLHTSKWGRREYLPTSGGGYPTCGLLGDKVLPGETS